MRYPIESISIIDITKPPYNADNTGRTDCTAALQQAIDDCLEGYIIGLKKCEQNYLRWQKIGKETYISVPSAAESKMARYL